MRSGLPSASMVAGAGGSLRAVFAGLSEVAPFFGPRPALAEKPLLAPAGFLLSAERGLVSRTKVLPSPRFGLSFEFICSLPEA